MASDPHGRRPRETVLLREFWLLQTRDLPQDSAIDDDRAGIMSLESGARLGHYVLRRSLGAGGMGKVYRGESYEAAG